MKDVFRVATGTLSCAYESNPALTGDYRHKWLVLTISTISAIFSLGTVVGFGAFFLTLLEIYGESRSFTALVQSLFIGFTLMSGIVSGSVVAKIGTSKSVGLGAVLLSAGFIVSFFATSILFLCFSVGLVAGFGVSLLLISSTAAIGNCFSGNQKVLAVTIQNVGISVGGILAPMFIEWSLSMYGLHGTFLVIGGINLNLVVSIIIFAYDEGGLNQSVAPGLTDLDPETVAGNAQAKNKLQSFKAYLSEWITIPYILVLAGLSISNSSLNGFISIIADIFVWKGFTSEDGLASLTAINITGLVFRLLPGLLKQIVNRTNSCIPPVLFGLLGAAGIVCMILGDSYIMLMAGSGLAGAPFGGTVVSASILCVKMSPLIHLPVAVGLMTTISGTFSIASGPIFGALYDMSASYNVVLIVVGACQLISSFFFMLAVRSRH